MIAVLIVSFTDGIRKIQIQFEISNKTVGVGGLSGSEFRSEPNIPEANHFISSDGNIGIIVKKAPLYLFVISS